MHLEAALRLRPEHIRTFTDLSYLYSREGRFDQQAALLREALRHSPADDNIIEGLITAHLVRGDYRAADSLFSAHAFAQRHRSYRLRDKYRSMRYGLAAEAFRGGDYRSALSQLEQALNPPSSLGADDFQFQSAPRLHYYLGLTRERLGAREAARQEFAKSAVGWELLSGDRDSFNSENFFMALALEKLGKTAEAARLLESMRGYAEGQLEDRYRRYRAEARYLLALARKHEGLHREAAELLEQSIRLEPDEIAPRLELRGDVPDPLPAEVLGSTGY